VAATVIAAGDFRLGHGCGWCPAKSLLLLLFSRTLESFHDEKTFDDAVDLMI
jgi:hypothetical protein